jgi:hypothetical protein
MSLLCYEQYSFICFWYACNKKLQKCIYEVCHVCLFTCLHGTTQEPLNRFSGRLTLQNFIPTIFNISQHALKSDKNNTDFTWNPHMYDTAHLKCNSHITQILIRVRNASTKHYREQRNMFLVQYTNLTNVKIFKQKGFLCCVISEFRKSTRILFSKYARTVMRCIHVLPCYLPLPYINVPVSTECTHIFWSPDSTN